MSIRHRHTRSHTNNRRSHHGLSAPRLSTCGNCGKEHVRHTMCSHCGQYRGKEVVDVVAIAEKKAEKAKERVKENPELANQTGDTPVEEKEEKTK